MASFARLGTAFLLAAAVGFPQKVASVRAGLVYHVEGDAAIDGVPLPRPLPARLPQLNAGQTIRTSGGHAEILMGPDSSLWMRSDSRLRFDDTSLDHGHISLLAGSVMIEIKSSGHRSLVVDTGGHSVELREAGLFRVDVGERVEEWRARVYSGEASLSGALTKLPAEREATMAGVQRFDPQGRDEFHWWAALRSLVLEVERGKFDIWHVFKSTEKGDLARHPGFGIVYPINLKAALTKYQAGSGPGTLYTATAEVQTGTGANQGDGLKEWPVRIPEGDFVQTERGRAEVLLGVGAVSWLDQNTKLRMVSARDAEPEVAIEQGVAAFEISNAAEAPTLQVRMGATVTTLRHRGVWLFDAGRGAVSVYDGESSTEMGSHAVHVRAGEQVLAGTGKVTHAAAALQNPLLQWANDLSYGFFEDGASFMTAWKFTSMRDEAQHRVFGKHGHNRMRSPDQIFRGNQNANERDERRKQEEDRREEERHLKAQRDEQQREEQQREQEQRDRQE